MVAVEVRRLSVACGLVASMGLLLALPINIAAQTYVKPGDTGSIDIAVESDATSVENAEGVEVSVETSAHFIVKGTSIKGPDTIGPGQTKTFTIDYEIAADAPEGPFDAIAKLAATTLSVDPDLSVMDTRLSFIVDPPPSITVADSAGSVLPGGFSSGRSISITVNDHVSATNPASGIEEVVVYKGDPAADGIEIGRKNDDYFEEHTYFLSDFGIPEPPETLITIRAFDKRGSKRDFAFTVKEPPQVAIRDAYGAIIRDGAVAKTRIITVEAFDNVALSTAVLDGPIHLEGPLGGKFGQCPFDMLLDGYYTLTVYDMAQNKTVMRFRIDNTPPSLFVNDHPILPQGNEYGSRYLGPYIGLTPAPGFPAIWLHNNFKKEGLVFHLEDDIARLGSFTLSRNGKDISNGSLSQRWQPGMISGTAEMTNVADGRGYSAELMDLIGNMTTLKFDIDSLAPWIDTDLKLRVSPGLQLYAAGHAFDDETGSLLSEVRIFDGTLPQVFDTGMVEGKPKMDFDISIPTPRENVAVLTAIDKSGLAGIGSYIGVFAGHDARSVNATANKLWRPDQGNFGNRLNGAAVSISCVRAPPRPPPCLELCSGPYTGEQLAACHAGCPTSCPDPAGAVGACLTPECGHIKVWVHSKTEEIPPQAGSQVPIINTIPLPGGVNKLLLVDTQGGQSASFPLELGPEFKFEIEEHLSSNEFWMPYGDIPFSYSINTQFGAATKPNAPKKPVDPDMGVSVSPDLWVQLPNVPPGPDNWILAMRVPAPPPAGYQYLPGNAQAVADIITGATYFGGPVTVRIDYDPDFMTADQQSKIRMFHYREDAWRDVTTQVDQENHQVSGSDDRLSLYGLFIATTAVGPVADGDRRPPVRALSLDGAGNLWEVLKYGDMLLEKRDAQGALLGSVVLPGARDSGGWKIAFDSQGGALVLGQGSGPTGAAAPVIYRASAAGDVLTSSRAFDSGDSLDYFAYDMAGAWVTGAKRTYGAGGAPQYTLALWRYSATDDSLALTATYSAGQGFDMGRGAAVDASGNVWVVGFSSNAATPGAAKLDLALWRFSPSGQIAAGPYRLPGYVAKPGGGRMSAQLLAHNGHLYASAGRLNAAGNYDLALVKYDAGGGLVYEQVLHNQEGNDDLPRALAADPNGGGLFIAGGSGFMGGDSRLALWSFRTDGTFVSAVTASDAGGASAMAVTSADTWLGVRGSSLPYRLTFGTELVGSPGPQEYMDLMPPITSLRILGPGVRVGQRLYADVTSSITLSAADPDFAAIPASGLDRTEYVLDGGAVSTFSTAFSLSEGSHEIRFHSLDKAGNWEREVAETVTVLAHLPMPEFAVLGWNGKDAQGVLHMFAGSSVTFTGVVDSATAMGFGAVRYSLDWEPYTNFTEPLVLSIGPHLLTYYPTDLDGNPLEVKRVDIWVHGVEALGAPGPITVVSRSSAALELSWDPAGNPAGAVYELRYGTYPNSAPACRTNLMSFPSALTVLAATAALNGLQPAQGYAVSVCNPALYAEHPADACGATIIAATSSGGVEPAPPFVACSTFPAGDIAGSFQYDAGFTGGRVFFMLGTSPDMSSTRLLGPMSAPVGSTRFDYTLTGLQAPATYYLAAFYDASGSMTSAPPLGEAPVGAVLTPLHVAPDSSAAAPLIILAPDRQAPGISILTPSPGSTPTASLAVIAGTAADDLGASAPLVAVQALSDGVWWVPAAGAFASTAPVWSQAAVAGPMNSFAWSLDAPGLGSAIQPGKDYAFYAQVSDLSGNVGSSTVTLRLRAMISGTVSYPGLPAGASVTVVASPDGFRSDPVFQTFTSAAGGFLSYSINVGAPASIQVGAFLGTDPERISTDTAIGFYNHFAGVPVGMEQSVSGIDFAIALDTQPPTAGITSLVDGATIAALALIQGTAHDDVAANGQVDVAVQDLSSGLWWDAQNTRWAAGGPLFTRTDDGPLGETASWSIAAGTGSVAGKHLNGLDGYLAQGRGYTVYAQAVDLVGNIGAPPATLSFKWVGQTSPSLLPAPAWITAQANSSTTIAWNWAPVEGAAGYAVYRSTAGPKQTAVPNPYFVLGNQPPNTARGRCVSAVNGYGEGPMVCARAYTLAAVPGQPQAVAASSHAITWALDPSGNPPGTYYALFLSTDAFATHFSTPIPFSMLYTSTRAVVSGLALDTLYYARVRAANGDMLRTVPSPVGTAKTGLADDSTAPSLTLAPPDGSTVTAAATQIVAAYSDDGWGVDLATLRLFLDGADKSTQTAVFASSAVFIAPELAQGTHTMTASISDLAGNPTAASATFFIDSLPPVTSLLVNGLPVSATQFVLVSTDSLGFSAEDAGTGVRQTLFSIDSSSAQVFQSTFSLALGTHTLFYQSADVAGNLEAQKAAYLTVRSTTAGFAVAVDFDPDTLNLKSHGKYVTATITVSGNRTAADIALDSLLITAVNDTPLASPIAPTGKPTGELQVKFDRQALIAVLPVGEQVKITLSGAFKDGLSFSAEGFIRTIMPGQAKAGRRCKFFHPGSGANVELPDGALPHDADITVTRLSAAPREEEDQRRSFAALHRLKTHGKPYDFGPEGTQFSIPVLLTLPYDLEALGDGDPRGLRLAYWNDKTSLWEPLDSTVDTKARTVSAKTTHFSLYQVVGDGGSSGGLGTSGFAPQAADAEFRYVDAYAFPNPARGSQNITVRTQVGLADSVDVNIYDLSGRLMDSGSAVAAQILDDGNGKGPQYTFDLVWNTSGAGSGIYIYAITAKKAGASSIHKRGKVGVLK